MLVNWPYLIVELYVSVISNGSLTDEKKSFNLITYSFKANDVTYKQKT